MLTAHNTYLFLFALNGLGYERVLSNVSFACTMPFYKSRLIWAQHQSHLDLTLLSVCLRVWIFCTGASISFEVSPHERLFLVYSYLCEINNEIYLKKKQSSFIRSGQQRLLESLSVECLKKPFWIFRNKGIYRENVFKYPEALSRRFEKVIIVKLAFPSFHIHIQHLNQTMQKPNQFMPVVPELWSTLYKPSSIVEYTWISQF